MVTAVDPAAEVLAVVSGVHDPEIPVLSIADLGILRGVDVSADGAVRVTITPTYSGCPAMEAIEADVRRVLAQAGYERVSVELTLSPAWTTDWLSEAGRRKLHDYGIAPPTGRGPAGGPVPVRLSVRCPQCGSTDTRERSRFGSTACKALWSCNACLEPFDSFKTL